MGYSFRLAARVFFYAPSHRQDSTYHCLCYTSRGSLAGTRNSSMGPMKDRSDDTSHHKRTLLPRSYISLRALKGVMYTFNLNLHKHGIVSLLQVFDNFYVLAMYREILKILNCCFFFLSFFLSFIHSFFFSFFLSFFRYVIYMDYQSKVSLPISTQIAN